MPPRPVPSLGTELKVFLAHPQPMRVLLLTNFLFAFALPVTDLFVAAYVMRNSQDPRMVMGYQMAVYAGIPAAFLANGFLLRRIASRALYGFGMVLATAAMVYLMALPTLGIAGVTVTGLIMGTAMGFYWANRDVLALVATNDLNRNYYYALEIFFGTLCGLVVPATVGWFIAGTEAHGWLGGDRNNAYKVLTGAVFVLACAATAMVCRGRFAPATAGEFLHWRFDALWRRVLAMSFFRGFGQGFGTVAPTILVMRLMGGQEGLLGAMQTGGMILMAGGVYVLGRIAKPGHRLAILGVGIALCIAGALGNALLYSAAGVIVYFVLGVLGRPLIDNAVTQVHSRAIELLAEKEGRSLYTYLFNNEFGLFAGRFAGGLLFIGVASLSEEAALRWVLLSIPVIQIAMYSCAKSVQRRCKAIEPVFEAHREAVPGALLK